MRPTSRPRRFARRDSAEVGVGTLIVFIAMVLVAAVAAAVIIGTSGTLQQRAQSTGQEATREVSSNIKVLAIEGDRTPPGDVDTLRFYLQLHAGAINTPLGELVIRYSDGTNVQLYKIGSANAFTLSWIRGSDGGDNVLEGGDLVELTLTPPVTLAENARFELALIPEGGSSVHLSLATPPTYGDDRIVVLHR